MRTTRWSDAFAALRDFLRGFTGIATAPPPPAHECDGAARRAPSAQPTPSEVRRGLAERAARRPSCC